MKKQTRRLLVNISAVLVVVNVVSALSIGVYLVSFYFPVVFDILGVYWIGSMVLALVLLIVSSVGKKAKNKYNNTNSKDNAPEDNFPLKLSTNIWSKVLTSAHKIQQIFNGKIITPQVSQHYKNTDNHSFHNATLSQEQPNANSTFQNKA